MARRLSFRRVGGLSSAALRPPGPSLSTAAAPEGLTVFGHYVSQPSRSVIWLLKMNEQPFNFVKVDVLKGEARFEAYKSKFPTCLIPGLADNGFYLAEGSAIMQYLCEKHGWEQWWPLGNDSLSRQRRAKIAEFLSSHHHTTRLISHNIARPLFTEKNLSDETKATHAKTAKAILKRFGSAFLKSGNFVNGMSEPTIADLTAYSEIGQILHFNILPDIGEYPEVKAWSERMSKLPFHDDVHQSNYKLGEMLRSR